MKKMYFLSIVWMMICFVGLSAQPMERVAVLYIDAIDVDENPVSLGNLLRLELQKMEKFEVVDRYDMLDMLNGSEIDLTTCYSKRCLTKAGELLEADKVLSGSIERYGDKILITLKMLDLATGAIEKTDVSEYLNEPDQVQHMVKMSLNSLFTIENDPNLVNMLTYYSPLTVMPTTKIVNNGPRMGMAYFIGESADRLSAPLNQGGYDASPLMTQFGYQQEVRYMSSGNFSALVEFIPMISGLEQSRFLPSLVVLNGFREGKTGLEFAFGPSFGVRKMANGYYANNAEGQRTWYLANQWASEEPNPYPIINQLDSRGDVEFFTRWVWAVGKTFRSGYLNIPVNAFVSYNKDDWMLGLSFGFNIRRATARRE